MADLSITPANVRFISGVEKRATAGVAIAAGKLIRLDTAGAAQLASDDTAANAQCVGMATSDAAAGQTVNYAGKDSVVNPGATVSAGKHYVVSTSGGIAPVDDIAGGEFAEYFGTGISTTQIAIGLKIVGVAAAAAVT